jgi:hypothetical protein
MTARGWLEAQGRRARNAALAATALAAGGAGAAVLAVGLLLERAGVAASFPELALVPWLGALAAGALVAWRRLPAVRAASPGGIGARVERLGGLRAGALAGLAGDSHGSPALAQLADRRMAGWLEVHGPDAERTLGRTHTRALVVHASAGFGGLILLAAAGVGNGETALWRPFAAIREARAPVVLTVDRTRVARGDSVTVRLDAPGRTLALLHQRRAGQAWTGTPLALDDGRAAVTIGPLDADLELVAESGRRRSDTVHVTLHPSLFLAELAVTARYSAYLDRPDEPLAAQGDTVSLPVGTVVEVQGRATLPLSGAAWQDGTRSVPLTVDGRDLEGELTVSRSTTWTLVPSAVDAVPMDGPPPSFTVVAVPDSAPHVTLVVPSADTVMPTTLIQALVIETGDDHRVTRLEIVSRRMSRLGTSGPMETEPVPLPADGLERGVLMAQLDLNQRGFLPGDTAYVRVRAADNAPRPQWAETAEIRLRFPSLAELRESIRTEAGALSAAADSLADAQRAVERAVEDLAQERVRDPADRAGGEGRSNMEFEQAERAGTLGQEQRDVLERAEELRERLAALDKTAWEAGLTDPALHAQLEELRKLLDRALTPELEAALRELERALERLDADAMRTALERLAEAQEALRRELERSRSLFERAALEGDLTTLAEDAAELAARQQEWNDAATAAVDSAAAAEEAGLAAQADSLAARLAEAQRAAAETGAESSTGAADQARQAAQDMQRASAAAGANRQQAAVQAGQRASERLDPLSQQLTEQREALREAWREEVTAQLDAALVETARLAQSQEQIVERLNRGDTGPDVRAAQGATRDGLEQVMARVQDAAGKNALVAPTLGMALGYSRNRMGESLEQLQQGVPNARGAAEAAAEALDGLNLLANQLLRSSGDVSSAGSGSGLAEAVERMAQLADQQGKMAGQTGGLLPLMQSAGQALMQQLRDLARQQRALAAELERLQAQGDQPGAGELAHEAEAIARALERGALTRETVERQEQLYRRLLDAGRLLRGPEADEEEERQSTTAEPGNVLLPTGQRPPEAGPRYRYPTWQELQGLSPADRRAVLEYFRMLNDARRP